MKKSDVRHYQDDYRRAMHLANDVKAKLRRQRITLEEAAYEMFLSLATIWKITVGRPVFSDTEKTVRNWLQGMHPRHRTDLRIAKVIKRDNRLTPQGKAALLGRLLEDISQTFSGHLRDPHPPRKPFPPVIITRTPQRPNPEPKQILQPQKAA
ncbi:MAG: hypothetical protein ABSH38_03440 [Verrucomicrobiota bacterium]|jgi:hypothetical protein